MKRIVIAILVCGALMVGGSLAYAAIDTSTPEKAAQACSEHHGFGAEPVDVAKTSDGSEVLAQVSWGANDFGWCYLILDGQATRLLRDHSSGSLAYSTPTPAPTPSPAEQTIIDNYPTFYACAVTGSRECQHPTPTPVPEPTVTPDETDETPIGQGNECLTTTGCSFSFFDVPGGLFLRVGIDIAPGKWNSDYEGAGERSCYALRLNEKLTTHPNYTDEVDESFGYRRTSWTSWFGDLLLVQLPSGRYTNHESVIERKSTDYVYGPRSFQIEIQPTDYAVIILHC
ncbi:hypothetical protein [Candidatus Poriferisocius sp.]|uniref:hypothetical protein n=1 Tax=Candidatus Poriferisocius sp. TaxID=3101276 RepID=UPI003B010285